MIILMQSMFAKQETYVLTYGDDIRYWLSYTVEDCMCRYLRCYNTRCCSVIPRRPKMTVMCNGIMNSTALWVLTNRWEDWSAQRLNIAMVHREAFKIPLVQYRAFLVCKSHQTALIERVGFINEVLIPEVWSLWCGSSCWKRLVHH